MLAVLDHDATAAPRPTHERDAAEESRDDLGPSRTATTDPDGARPEAVAKRHASAAAERRRENVADLVDEGTFVEYGPLMFAAQERRRSDRS